MSASANLAALSDLSAPWALRVAATLRLADHIASGATELDELAAKADADPDALGRLLRFLACRGVFAEPAPDCFALTDAAEVLRDGHPSRLRAWLDLNGAGGRMDRAWAGLLDAVRGGAPGYAAVFGRPFWEDLDAERELGASFECLLGGAAAELGPVLADAYEWSGVAHVVDVGGGSGALLAALLRAHPHLRGTLVDLPGTAAAARAALAQAGLAERCRVVAGSAFDPLPEGGDVYLLSWVLHDWADAPAERILRRCAEAAGPRGRVLLVEAVATPGAPAQLVTALDLRMLVLVGGRERTASEYEALAQAAGLELCSVRPTRLGRSLLELRPAG